MLIEDARILESLRKIITRFTADPVLRQDLAQECLVRLWRLESEQPGRTRSWYLQNCRFHLQHWLASGRSLDSLKRTIGDNRIAIDGINDEHVLELYHTNGEVLEVVSARDIIATLARHLKPCERAMLGDLADGLVLQDIAVRLKLSYPTALKYRRKIAALTVKLGIASPLPHKKANGHPVRRVNGVRSHNRSHNRLGRLNGIKRRDALPGLLSGKPGSRVGSNGD